MAPPPPHFTIDHKIEDQIGWGVDHFLRDIATHAAKIKHICTLASSRHIEDSSGANHKRQQCVREDDGRETHNSFYDRHLASCDILSRYNKRIYVEQGPSFTEEFQGIKTNLTQIPLKFWILKFQFDRNCQKSLNTASWTLKYAYLPTYRD